MVTRIFKVLPVVMCLNVAMVHADTVADQEVARKVVEKIGPGWFSSGYDKVNVQVNDGYVTLSGYVKTPSDKEKVEREVRNISGVINVDSKLRVEEPSGKETRKYPQDSYASSSDEQLNKKIRDAVSNGWLWDSYKDVSVHTHNGVVTIEGAVRDRKDEQKILTEIQKVPGIQGIRSNLRVQNPEDGRAYARDERAYARDERKYPQDSAATLSDEQLNSRIRDAVSNGWLWNSYKDIAIHTNNGVVSVQGFVKDLSDQQKILGELQKVPGIRAIRIDLRIQGPEDTRQSYAKDERAYAREERKYPQDSAATLSDEQLNSRIRDAVSNGWLWDSYKDISIHTNNGFVSVRGLVKDLSDQQKILGELQKVQGIRAIRIDLRIQNPQGDSYYRDRDQNFYGRDERSYGKDERAYAKEERAYARDERKYPQDTAATLSDEQLNNRIRDAVSNGWLWDSYKDVSIHSSNGDVSVEGVVKELKDQQKILSEIQKVPGVRSVKSNLRIQAQEDAKYYAKDDHKYPQDTAATVSDQELNSRIRDAVSNGWLWDSYKDVSIRTNNGDVTVEGLVKEMKDQQKILSEIQKVQGVRSVRSNLRIQYQEDTRNASKDQLKYPQDTAMNLSDEQLNRKIRDAVSNGWLWDSYKDVSIHTNNGDVTVEGVVKELKDQQKILSEVQKIPGVKSVRSTLRIQTQEDASHANTKEARKYPQDTAATVSDQELNNRIRDAVSNGWLWDSYKEVSIQTKNGDVSVEGAVKELKDQQKILSEIQKIPGVRSVRSNLRIQY